MLIPTNSEQFIDWLHKYDIPTCLTEEQKQQQSKSTIELYNFIIKMFWLFQFQPENENNDVNYDNHEMFKELSGFDQVHDITLKDYERYRKWDMEYD